tara:strand:- start:399 stop:500 length:102 start_codon:yes stop_codon:yes gene_type:complete
MISGKKYGTNTSFYSGMKYEFFFSLIEELKAEV